LQGLFSLADILDKNKARAHTVVKII